MKTKKRQITEQSEPLSFEPSNEPSTIPTGWDVTSFYKLESPDTHNSSQTTAPNYSNEPHQKHSLRKSGTSMLSQRHADSPAVLYIDLHLVHEVTSPQAFTGLRQRGLKVSRPERTVATIDHGVPTRQSDGSPRGRMAFADDLSAKQIPQMEENCREFGIHSVWY